MKTIILLTTTLACFWTNSFHAQHIHHELDVTLNIAENTLQAVDNVSVPAHLMKDNAFTFMINSNLKVETTNSKFKLTEVPQAQKEGSIFTYYTIQCPEKLEGKPLISIEYSGKVNEEIKTGAAEYARGFSETSGIISETGVYLAGSTYWIPMVEKELASFNMTVTLAADYNVVSQGKRTKNEVAKGKRIVRYESPEIMDDVYLIAAKFTEYNKTEGDVLVQAFLRTPDEELANKYLEATGGFLVMYEKLIGKYPFTKFALVENFWETGYGMPSFTLLGEKVIRFPWLLYSSYPHELLHNWWGNSVYVESETGNWCEGLTAYMADHLLKEQRGGGADYRRGTLQKFTDYVNETNDFPVKDFRSRNNSAEEAIGYGKVSMMNDMIRLQLGDEVFIKAYADFYANNKYKRASFDDIRKSFEKVSEKDLKPFFDQWVLRKGAPTISLSNVVVTTEAVTSVKDKTSGNMHELSFTISQIQKEDVFNLNIPVAVYLEGETDVVVKNLSSTKREETYKMMFDKRPLRIDVDPQFNVFRRLDRVEVPLALSQIFGSTESVMILPKESPHLSEYEVLADTWKKSQEAQKKKLEVKYDSELEKLPADKAVWIVGFENKFANEMKVPDTYSTYLTKEDNGKFDQLTKDGSLVYVLASSSDNSITNGFVGTTNAKAVAGLIRKLPHYGKYGYLGFTGDEPTNVMKGSFPTLDSPLSHYIKYKGDTPSIIGKLKPRKALAY